MHARMHTSILVRILWRCHLPIASSSALAPGCSRGCCAACVCFPSGQADGAPLTQLHSGLPSRSIDAATDWIPTPVVATSSSGLHRLACLLASVRRSNQELFVRHAQKPTWTGIRGVRPSRWLRCVLPRCRPPSLGFPWPKHAVLAGFQHGPSLPHSPTLGVRSATPMIMPPMRQTPSSAFSVGPSLAPLEMPKPAKPHGRHVQGTGRSMVVAWPALLAWPGRWHTPRPSSPPASHDHMSDRMPCIPIVRHSRCALRRSVQLRFRVGGRRPSIYPHCVAPWEHFRFGPFPSGVGRAILDRGALGNLSNNNAEVSDLGEDRGHRRMILNVGFLMEKRLSGMSLGSPSLGLRTDSQAMSRDFLLLLSGPPVDFIHAVRRVVVVVVLVASSPHALASALICLQALFFGGVVLILFLSILWCMCYLSFVLDHRAEDPRWAPTLEFRIKLEHPVACELDRYLHTCRVKIIDESCFPSDHYRPDAAPAPSHADSSRRLRPAFGITQLIAEHLSSACGADSKTTFPTLE